ncbi:amino acid permease [Candidatus Micrarchaeota archaeon]|nr:amino acid permease [Candidatus Micrarchaeota archaeon]
MAHLKRALGLLETAICGVGIILGAGIYALIGAGAGLAGSALWLAFVIAAIVSAFSALSYAELSSMFPKAASTYEYVRNAFGRGPAFIIGWLMLAGLVVSSVTVSIGFANYFSALTDTPQWLGATVVMAFCFAILLLGIRESALIGIITTAIEVLGLIIVIAIAVPHFGSVDYFEMSALGIGGVFAAAALVFFAYLGFEDMVKLSEEVKEPKKTMPRAIILAISFTTVLYVLVAIAAVSILPWNVLGESKAPLADVAGSVFGSSVYDIVAIIALFATGNTVLFMLLAGSRLIYGMADSGAFPKQLAFINNRGVPIYATIAICGITYILTYSGNIMLAALVTDLLLFTVFAAVNASVITLRYKLPGMKRGFRVPLSIGKLPLLPLFGFFTSLLLIASVGVEAFPYAVFILLAGAAVYFARNRKIKIKNENREKKK